MVSHLLNRSATATFEEEEKCAGIPGLAPTKKNLDPLAKVKSNYVSIKLETVMSRKSRFHNIETTAPGPSALVCSLALGFAQRTLNRATMFLVIGWQWYNRKLEHLSPRTIDPTQGARSYTVL